MANMNCPHLNLKLLTKFNSVSLNQCQECQLILSDRYDSKNLEIEKLYYNYYKNEVAGKFNFGLELIIRLFRFFRAFKIFTIYPRAKTVLDIGSGRGFTLYFLKKYYKYNTAIGTQIEENALKFSRDKLGLEIYDKDLLELELPQSSFDLITVWQVLEHVTDPEGYIIKIFQLLNKGGRIIIEVPNFNSWTRKLTAKYWLGLDLKYHLTFFTHQSLSKMLTKYQFKIKLIHTFSLEYSTFISTQSIISRLTSSDQLIFNWLQGNIKFQPVLIVHIFLFAILCPICFIINLLLFFSKRGEVLLIVAEK